MIILALVLLGLCFGSFVNALVWRLHQQAADEARSMKHEARGRKVKSIPHTSYSILRGRSMCVHCKHVLSARDLLPIVSWLSLGGKCRYCKKPVSWQYPLVEMTTVILFVLSYAFWPFMLHDSYSILLFALWLVCLVGFMALVVYDLRWMLLPNKIVFPLYVVTGLIVVLRVVQESSAQPAYGALMGVAVGGGIFYLLFQISDGKWIGGGDVKLGFLIGALVGSGVQAMLVLFFASVLGTLAATPLLLTKRATRSSRIPFGPFLIAACVIVMLFGVSLTDWYTDTLLG